MVLVPLKGRDQINVVFNAVSEYLRTLSRDERIDTELLIDDPLNNDTYELTLSGGKILESRKMMREDVDFQLAMHQNADYLNQTYGDRAAKNAQESADFLAMLGNATLGEEFTKMLNFLKILNVVFSVGEFVPWTIITHPFRTTVKQL